MCPPGHVLLHKALVCSAGQVSKEHGENMDKTGQKTARSTSPGAAQNIHNFKLISHL